MPPADHATQTAPPGTVPAARDGVPPTRLSGTWNFRDLGGTPTADGRHIRPGVLFRAATLQALDERGRADLVALGIRTSYDLRGPREIARTGADTVPASVTVLVRPFNAEEDETPAHETHEEERESPRTPADGMRAYNASLPGSPNAQSSLAEYLRVLAGEGGTLVHCAAGKDRTGWAVAVALQIAGVDWPTIMADYLLSNDAVPELAAFMLAEYGPDTVTDPALLGVDSSYLQAAQDAMLAEFGSLDAYLEAIGLRPAEIHRLRDRLIV
ncbi:tyrosine-protein phosphatase [Nakamurella flavida]|uniref:Tyrosine-protein phosphatase n=1 Tax=Nakamurella flavida TaxID=363630 RepID=A0A938YQJ1_9ACTN|nr:tyrosine-protein phosphatase [Nakamurella flavida]MBM9477398.1 tyrosine-protein phosphatase [Nakamurella flavida]MDP9777331.1 protein-tyrosine phosphatase [Nakamurella flavida]